MKAAILCLFVASAVAELPSFIKPCHRDDPAVNKCFVTNGNEGLPSLVVGHQGLQFPALKPVLKHPGAKYDNDEFYFEMKETDVFGLDTIKLEDAKIDFEKKTIWMEFKFTKVDWIGTYVAKAKKANDEVSDKAHVTYHENEYTANLSYDIKDGHLAVKSINVKFAKDPKVDFELDNLDKHEAVKAQWPKEKAGFLEVGNKALGEFMTLVFTNVFKAATFDEIFPPKA